MSINQFIFLAVLSLFSSQVFAQIRCNADEHFAQNQKNVIENVERVLQMESYYQEYISNPNKLGKASGVKYSIPIVFHIVHKPADAVIGSGSNISDLRIYQQLEILNQDFRKIHGTNGDGTGADVQIEFVLAQKDPDGNCHSGINRISSNVSTNTVNFSDNTLMMLSRLSYWDNKKYLNYYVIDKFSNNLFGLAHFPWDRNEPAVDDSIDYVACVASSVGRSGGNTGADYGRTGTHEIGHWLGLYHIFSDDSLCVNDTCSIDGDKVCDTPPQKFSTSITVNCSRIFNTCNTDANSGIFVRDTNDFTNNYMDYSNDQCMNSFTQGQKTRMLAFLNQAPRSTLWQDSNLRNTGATALPLARFNRISKEANGKIRAMKTWYLFDKGGWLVVAGDFDSIGGIKANGLALFEGSRWFDWFKAPPSMKGKINAIEIFENNVYVGGSFTDTAYRHLAKYNGTKLISVTANDIGGVAEGPSHSVNALQTYKGKLYIAGDFGQLDFNSTNLNAKSIGSWDGSRFEQLGAKPYGVSGNSSAVYCLGIHEDKLVVGGRFAWVGFNTTADKVVLWDGEQWESITKKVHPNGRVNTVLSHNGLLYAGGNYFGIEDSKGGFLNYYDTSWKPTVNFGLDCNALAVYRNQIMVGGNISNLGGEQTNNFAIWDPIKKNYRNVGENFNGLDEGVTSMHVFKDSLWIGGNFKRASGIRGNGEYLVSYLAQFSQFCDTTKPATSVRDIMEDEIITAFPNPTTGIVNFPNGEGDGFQIKYVSVTDMSGKKMRIEGNRTEKGTQVNFSGLTAGVYYVICTFKSNAIAPQTIKVLKY